MSAGPEAWHEAGHALAAHLCGGRVREVTLESELDGHEGHVAVEWPGGDARAVARRSALVALAGPVAEVVFRGDDVLDDPDALAAWRGDWGEADAQLAALFPREAEREGGRRRVLCALRDVFDAGDGYDCLARLADALDAHETLDEPLFLEALGDAWRDARALGDDLHA